MLMMNMVVERSSASSESETRPREVQVDPQGGKKPRVVARLADWEYLERSLHRALAGWGRSLSEWDDKIAVSHHVWEQAECVRRVRSRRAEFPGTKGEGDAAVSEKLERLVNAALLAPSLEDALDGLYGVLNAAVVRSYIGYAEVAHPIHDAPTLAAVAENVRAKEGFRLWLRDRRRAIPHVADPAYLAGIEAALAACDHLTGPVTIDGETASPVGVRTDFRPAARSPHPAGTLDKPDIMPFLEADFANDLEARRLFWCYAYMRELNLAEDQLKWIYDGHAMPWDFLHDVSRHMWDESRHGHSGRSRLMDFGIDITETGFPYYDKDATQRVSEAELSMAKAAVMSPKDLYENVFFIGMVAETGHFAVKHEAYADFKDGGDLESAEMMIFDIIDETTHVQYAHKWLPVLAERAGVTAEDYKKRGALVRQAQQAEADARAEREREIPREGPAYELYESLVRRMRDKLPLTNAATCPPRSAKPM